MVYICNYCNSKETLPFTCNYCKKTFCRKHCAYDKHSCTIIVKSTYRYKSEQEIDKNKVCSICDNKEGIHECGNCNKLYCEKHAFPWHKCSNIKDTKKEKSCFSKFCCIFNFKH